jgi:hypothetical protein
MNREAQYYRKTLIACAITAVVETILVLGLAEPLVLFFVLGPLLFLVVIAARRRTHLTRIRRISGVAIGAGAFGITSFGVAFLMHRGNAQPGQVPIAPLVVPLVQWLMVLVVWITISREESRENRGV